MFQEGGEMPAEQTPAEPMEQTPEAGNDPMGDILNACNQALQTQDCNIAMQVCEILLQMAGGQQGAPQAPENAQPVYKKGGKLSRWIKK